MLKRIILLVFVDIFILFLIVTCLFTGVHHNAIYNKYIDDVMDIKAVVESVREESDGEDSEYHVYARYEYNGTLYRGYVGSFTSKYEEGDLIELKVFKDDPSLLFNIDNGIWGVFGGMLFYFILIWLSWIMIQDILYKSKKKEISSKHIYGNKILGYHNSRNAVYNADIHKSYANMAISATSENGYRCMDKQYPRRSDSNIVGGAYC